MEKFKKHPYIIAFLLSLVLGLMIVVPNIIRGGGIFTFVSDYNAQQIPFNIAMSRAFKNGSFIWNWYNDLGASFLGSYGLYNIFSPFTMILWLFPTKWAPYLMGPIFALKYAIAGLTSYMFLSRHVKDKKWALVGCLLYAFSGFQFTNTLFYHFHDVVAFFPLLLYGLDRLVRENKREIFLLAVILNAVTNYYFFIGQVVFVIVYYIVMLVTGQYKWSLKRFCSIAIESILGVLVSCFIFLPSILFVLGNPRVEQGWTLLAMLIPEKQTVLEILRSMIMPNDSMSIRSIITSTNFGSVEAYLPFVGAVLWLSYIIKKPKTWPSILMLVVVVFMLVPILNNSFFALTTTYYARWFYMATLVMALLSAKALDEHINIVPGIMGTFGLLIVFLIIALFTFRNVNFINNSLLFLVILIFMFSCILALYIIMTHSKKPFKWLIVCVSLYIVVYGNYFIYYNKRLLGADERVVDNYEMQGEALEWLDDNSRHNVDGLYWNLGLLSEKMIVNSWNSNIEGGTFDFYKSIGVERGVATNTPVVNKDLQSFLSVEYIASFYVNEELSSVYGEPIKKNGLYFYKNSEYRPLGVDYSSYILKDDFLKLEMDERIKLLNKAIIIEEEQVDEYKDILKEYDGSSGVSSLESSEFERRDDGFDSRVVSKEDTLILYTVPYSSGWSATVNGEDRKIEKVDSGFMAVRVDEGESEIKFRYRTPGAKVGRIVSIVGLVSSCIYFVVVRKEVRK